MPRPRFENLSPEKRSRILETAARAFAAYGYEGASMNQILAEADISKGAAYYYFDNKADLYATTVTHYMYEFMGDLNVDVTALTAVSFWPALLQLYHYQFTQFTERPWVLGLVKSGGPISLEMLENGPLAEIWQELTTLIDNLIRRGRELGVIRTDLPEDLLIALVMALDDTHDRWLKDKLPTATPEERAQFAAQMVDLLKRLLAPV